MPSTAWRPWRSLRVLAGALLLVLLLVPALLYSLLADWQGRQRALLVASVRDAGTAIAAGLRPTLHDLTPDAFETLDAALLPYAEARRSIILLFHPATGAAGEQFFLVAGAPRLSPADAAGTQAALAARGVLPALSRSCDGGLPLAERVAGADGTASVLTSVTGIAGATGCWAVVIAVSSADLLAGIDDRPFWRQPEVQIALSIYVLMATLILAIFAAVRANLARIRQYALEPSAAGGFAAVTSLPEIAPVARAIDAMVLRLRATAEHMRQAAEDNAHAFKGPIATIRQAVEPLLGTSPPPPERVRPALIAVAAALERLDGLVRSARQLDSAAADLLEIAAQRVDLRALLQGLADEPRGDGVSVAASLSPAVVSGEADAIETVFENLLDNAAGFSPAGGTVRVRLETVGPNAVVTIEDDGPGVPPERLGEIFERYVTDRAAARRPGTEAHFGIGLWIARQNTRALGGEIGAENRAPHGLRMRVSLPLAG